MYWGRHFLLSFSSFLILSLLMSCHFFGGELDKAGELINEQDVAWGEVDNPNHLDLTSDFKYLFAELPTQGAAEPIPWAGSYWPTYKDSINDKWNGPNTQSPSEKYAAGFNKTGITDGVSADYGIDSQNHRTACTSNSDCDSAKNETCSKRAGVSGGFCIETWFGICHAWAPLATMELEPKYPVEHNGVTFKVNDLKALLTLSYDKGLKSKMMSGRCNAAHNESATVEENPIKFNEWGIPTTDACADTNPGSFHVVVANMLGIKKKGFVEDRTWDYQVWNQPIRSFKVTKNTVVTAQKANQLICAGVTPPPANCNSETYAFNDEATELRHMKTTLKWIGEPHQELDGNLGDVIDDYTNSDRYEYILEIDRHGKIIGGEWIGASKRSHPDFMWAGVEKTETEVAVPSVQLKEDNITPSNGEFVDLGSVTVVPGADLHVKMTGTGGDADLYVRFSYAPTTSNYTCRPYRADSNEECKLKVPAGKTKAYVKVKVAADGITAKIVSSLKTPGTGIAWSDIKMLLEKSLVNPQDPSGGDTGGFNWGSKCDDGEGEFDQPVLHRATIVVGEIPPDKDQVEIKLNSVEDVDIQLIDKATGTELIAWPNGSLNGSGESCTTYENVKYCYSGYNGDGTNYGNEWIRIENVTNRQLVMKAYGYAAGQAKVNYNWKAPAGCVDEGSGTFSQAIIEKAIVDVGVIPSGKKSIKIQLTSDKDVDVQLYDGETALVKWPDGSLKGPSSETLNYQGMKIIYSGYNGDCGSANDGTNGCGYGNEYIKICGEVSRDLTMKAFGYAAGDAQVDYAWGVSDADLGCDQ